MLVFRLASVENGQRKHVEFISRVLKKKKNPPFFFFFFSSVLTARILDHHMQGLFTRYWFYRGKNNCSQTLPHKIYSQNWTSLQIATVWGSVYRGLCCKCLTCQSAEMYQINEHSDNNYEAIQTQGIKIILLFSVFKASLVPLHCSTSQTV